MAMTNGSAQPNVTPLIDVLLTLLVIFMVITPIAPKGEDALVPQPPRPGPQPGPETVVVVQVHRGRVGETLVRINREDVPWSTLQQRLMDIFKMRAKKVLFVSADDQIPWMDVADVVGIAHAAGVDNVALMTAKLAGR